MHQRFEIIVDSKGQVFLSVRGLRLDSIGEVYLEYQRGLHARIKVKLRSACGLSPEAAEEVRRENARNRLLLQEIPYVEVYEPSVVPGLPAHAREDERTRVETHLEKRRESKPPV